MREIKFRVWDIQKKEMLLENYNIDFDSSGNWRCGIVNAGGDYFDTVGDEEAVLMQFTGIKDKNGKEIYEGDILQLGENLYYFVEYKNDRFWLSTPTEEASSHEGTSAGYYRICLAAYRDNEIVGNIYENPELLK